MSEEIEMKIAFTIEQQLKAYSECNKHTERHEILWNEWYHNKRWLMKIQQLILPSYISYSLHDASHAESVLHNIEMLLGETNIRNLSATDCFVILHTVYIHDIGMCITHFDREKILKENRFYEFLIEQKKSGTPKMAYYAQLLIDKCIQTDSVSEDEKQQYILNKKLDIYYAVSYLLAEYRRKEHGNVSEQRLEMWINESDKLGMGFSAVEIPDRIFFMIAKCASSHTKYGFEPVMDLHQEDSGYAHDYVHPRFVAVLLQLGDALDMDNDRFHPLIKEFAGKMPEMSELHYKKHKSIRRLRINNQKITISADCENQDVLRLVRQEYGIIREILEKASYYWSVIRPKGASVGLPSLDKANLLLNGKEVPEELVEARFEIPQEKAFHLLEGNNIYIDENFVFLRELLQNAVDATKIQFYRDCKRQICRVIPEDNSEKTLETYIESPRKIKEILSPRQYPIEIKLIMAKRKAGVCEEINKEDVLDPKEKLKEYECGVLVTIQDFGTGISTGDIKKIADVGSSYESRKNEIKKMPQWLQPTGTFGIGLQSAFLADSRLIAKTFTRDGDNYVIEFSPRRTGANGYINVTPSNEINEDRIPYGTCFEIFVPHSRKKLHRDSMETWEGTDPFIASYDYNRPIRHTRELIKQMAYYLADMVGEPLFPINLFINDTYERVLKEKYRGKSGKHEFYSHYGEVFQQKFKDSGIRVYVNGSSLGNEDDGNKKKRTEKISWAYNLDGKRNCLSNKDCYFLDEKRMKLYVWNYEHNAFGCLGIGRILEMREQLNQEDDIECKLGTAVFYKGIKVTEKYFNEDANMLEYIDLKKTLDNSYLKLNRNGFSTEGDKQLTKAYRALLNTAGTVLAEFADKNKVIERIIKDIKTSLSEVKDEDDEKTIASVRRKIMSAVALLYFASVHANSYEMKMHKQTDGAGAMGWNQLIEELADVWNDPEKAEKVKWVKQSSEMFNLPVLKYKNGEVAEDIEYQSIVDIANRNRKYAIMSVREKKSHFWNEYVIEITSVDESIKSEINTLSMVQDDMEQRIEAMRELSGLVKPLFAVNYETYIQEGKIGLEKIRKDMTILRWILNNVPTMAVFSNNTGDMRLNILDLEVTDTVYFDENMKYLILQRMLEPTFNKIETVYRVRKHAERFSTIVWPGYKDLVIDNMRRSVMSVNRGKMSAVGCSEMIFPLSHQLLKQIDKAIRDDVQIQAIQKYGEKVLKPISEYIDSVPEELRTKFRENLSRLLCDEQMKEKIDSWGKDWLPNGSLDLDENTCKQFVEQFKENILVNADNLTDTEKKAVAVIQWLAVTYKAEMTNTSYKADFAKKLDEEEEVYHNLLRYVSKNSRFKTVESEVDRMYRNMVVEVAYIIRKKTIENSIPEKEKSLIKIP